MVTHAVTKIVVTMVVLIQSKLTVTPVKISYMAMIAFNNAQLELINWKISVYLVKVIA